MLAVMLDNSALQSPFCLAPPQRASRCYGARIAARMILASRDAHLAGRREVLPSRGCLPSQSFANRKASLHRLVTLHAL